MTSAAPSPSDISPSAALALAVTSFNHVFDYRLRLPMEPQFIESAAIIAEQGGQPKLAAQLRAALKRVQKADQQVRPTTERDGR